MPSDLRSVFVRFDPRSVFVRFDPKTLAVLDVHSSVTGVSLSALVSALVAENISQVPALVVRLDAKGKRRVSRVAVSSTTATNSPSGEKRGGF